MEGFVGACSTAVPRYLKLESFVSLCRRIAGPGSLMTMKVRASVFCAAILAAITVSPAVTFAGPQAPSQLSQSIQRPDKSLRDLVESSLIEIEYCVKKEEHQGARSRRRRIPDPSIKKSDSDEDIVCPIETNL
jgi:hypothetical protein